MTCESERDNRVAMCRNRVKGFWLVRGLPQAMDVPYPASNHVSHSVAYPPAGREKAMACGRLLWSGVRPRAVGVKPIS